MKISVVIIDDNPKLIASTSQMLSFFDEVELYFSVSNDAELFKKLKTQQPNVILMDIDMPNKNGIELTAMVKKMYPSIKIIMLTVFDDEDKIFEAVLAGADGYLLKDEKPVKVISAILDVMNGDAPMSPLIARKALELIKNRTTKVSIKTQENNLTVREIEILEKMSKGLNYIEIADQLFISPNTVRKHCNNIYEKLHVHNKVEAIKIGFENRWF